MRIPGWVNEDTVVPECMPICFGAERYLRDTSALLHRDVLGAR